ncbi:hypothetical protein LTR85_003216 [Meristemomyces frigidus]|nr:hypothetical protein LTR85_003216 [Meristemomyces frigidus]
MVAPTFGFSVGDFVAAIQVTITAYEALQDTDGAASQYQQAVIKLKSLRTVLLRLQALERTNSNSDIVQQIQFCAHACSLLVTAFVDKVRRYDKRLAQLGSSKFIERLASSGQKVRWVLSMEKALAKLEASIAPHLAMIEILLHLEGSKRASALQHTTEEGLSCLKRVVSKLENTEAAVAALATKDSLAQTAQQLAMQVDQGKSEVLSAMRLNQASTAEMLERLMRDYPLNVPNPPAPPTQTRQTTSNVPCTTPTADTSTSTVFTTSMDRLDDELLWKLTRKRVDKLLLFIVCFYLPPQQFIRSLMAMTRSVSLLLDNNIRVEDALGRTLSLPYEHFRYWPILEKRLEVSFRGLPGEAKVRRNEYQLMDFPVRGARTFRVLNAKSWESSVSAGSRVVMSILFDRPKHIQRVCPGCSTRVEKRNEQELVTWQVYSILP